MPLILFTRNFYFAIFIKKRRSELWQCSTLEKRRKRLPAAAPEVVMLKPWRWRNKQRCKVLVFAAYGVMTRPALVVDGKVVSYGKVLKTEEVVKILQKIR